MLKKAKRRSIITLMLALTMTLTTTGLYVYAQPTYNNDEEGINKAEDITSISSDLQKDEYNIPIAEEITGVLSDSSLENLFHNAESDSIKRNLNSNVFPKLQNVSFTVLNDNVVAFNSELVFDETNIYELSSTGKVYTANEGGLQDKVFLVDMENSDDYHFVQMRIDTSEEEYPFISIIIQSILTEELLHFETVIDSQLLVEIADIADSSEKETFSELYDVGKNLINPVEQSTLTVRGTGDSTYSEIEAFVNDEGDNISNETEVDDNTIESSISPLVASYSNWRDFFRELDRYEYAYLDEHSVDRYAITNNGWQNVVKNGSGPYAISSYVRSNGSTEKLVDIIMMDVIHTTNSSYNQRIQLYVDYVFKLSYNTRTEKVTVLYHNWGPSVYNLELLLSIEDGISNSTTVFTSREIDGRLTRTPSRLRAAIGLVDKYAKWFDCWDDLGDFENQIFGDVRDFEDTFTKQSDKYNGEVIRGIYTDSGNWELDSAGHNLYIRGDVYNGYSNCSKYNWEYRVSTN